MVLPTNIRLGCNGLPGTNAQAYYENLYIMAIKSFITLSPVLVGMSAITLYYTALLLLVSMLESQSALKAEAK